MATIYGENGNMGGGDALDIAKQALSLAQKAETDLGEVYGIVHAITKDSEPVELIGPTKTVPGAVKTSELPITDNEGSDIRITPSGVARVPIADSQNFGTVKVSGSFSQDSGFGVYLAPNGQIRVPVASATGLGGVKMFETSAGIYNVVSKIDSATNALVGRVQTASLDFTVFKNAAVGYGIGIDSKGTIYSTRVPQKTVITGTVPTTLSGLRVTDLRMWPNRDLCEGALMLSNATAAVLTIKAETVFLTGLNVNAANYTCFEFANPDNVYTLECTKSTLNFTTDIVIPANKSLALYLIAN